MTAHPCVMHPGRVHPTPCECFRGGPAPEWPAAASCPVCSVMWVVRGLWTDCVDKGHVGGVEA